MTRSLALLTLLFALAALAPAQATDGVDRGLLWKVEHSDAAAPSYIFGTLHSADERVVDLPAAVDEAFASADRFLFELDFAEIFEGQGMMRMFYLDDRRLSHQLSDELWERTRSVAADRGIVESSLDRMKPWTLATMLSVPQEDPTQMLDHRLYQRAKNAGHSVGGLETAAEQIGIFDDLPLDQQIAFLERAIEHIEEERVDTLYNELVERYIEQDLASLVRLADEHPALPGTDEQAALMRRLVDERNQIMVTRMESALREGSAFVAIGALHLPGERGIVRLLERKGHTVSPVDW